MSMILDLVQNFVHSGEKMSQKKEVRKMKKFLGILMVFAMVTSVWAANPDQCKLTVMVEDKSVAIDQTSADFGTVTLSKNDARIKSSSGGGGNATGVFLSVLNDGNVTETFGLKVSSSTGDVWKPAAAIGSDLFVLYALFATVTDGATAPTEAQLNKADNLVTGANLNSTADIYSSAPYCASNGVSVSANKTLRTLWLGMDTPNATSSYATQTFWITVTAG